ncbi:heparinase II/III domain-containing protein [Rhodocyclus tenuis]|uniref:heparinase II/III domain-containing protein n=1 Tax=Rhodocyclus tenuis TaxID=1066 RepID=UPI00190846B2|nr:heparinase II/III family protein [Rhodocyclus tenuis]
MRAIFARCIGLCAALLLVAAHAGADVEDSELRLASENWALAQKLVRSDKDWQSWLTGRRQLMDQWMSRPRDQADWVSGWGHELVDPLTQAPLRWTPEMPLPADGPGAQGKLRRAWMSWERSYNFDRVAEAARLYRLTGESRYAEWAAGQLDFYADNYSKWPLRTWNGKARMMGQSLDEATGTVVLIEAFRLLKGFASASRQLHWREQLFLPIVENLSDFNQGVNNIALWHAVAISVVGMQLDEPTLLRRGLDGAKGVRALLKAGITDDFLWYEGSFTYNAYVLRALAPLFINAALSGHAASLQGEMAQAKKMLLAPLQLRFDDGLLPTPGDANARTPAVELGLFFELYRALDTRIGRVEAQRRKGWETLVDPRLEPLPPLDALPPVRSVHLEATRMAMLKSGDWQVFVHYGQLTQHHAQEEALSPEIHFQATPLVADPGTVSYGSELHEKYFRRAIAHNSPLVDGGGQVGWNPGVMKRFDAAAATLAVSQPRYRPDAAAERTISLRDGELSDVVTIRLNPDVNGEHRLGFLFNTECAANLAGSFADEGSPVLPPMGNGTSFWQDTTVRSAPARWQAELDCGKKRFRLAVELSGPHRVYLASAPTTPLPKRRTVLYMELTGRAATMRTTLTPAGVTP